MPKNLFPNVLYSKHDLLNARIIILIAYFSVAVIYFIWRLTVFHPDFMVYSTIFYIAELMGFFWAVVSLLSMLHFKKRIPKKPKNNLSVDVFIPTYNEPEELLRRTITAAMRISYPHKTWILDDGNRQNIKMLAENMGCHYIARTQNTDAKAGNINNALAKTDSEFIAFLDADFIATPEFLDETLGYFEDLNVGFVQTPQEYYNHDSYQHVGQKRHRDGWSEHSLFFQAQQRGRDYYNAAMMCGSAAIMRRKTLDDVGGFATTTVTEDMHTSTLIHSKGWKSVYHPKTLSAGLAPHDAKSFLNQRLRWAQGAMQVARQEGLFGGKIKLTFFQRLAYIMHVGNYVEGPRHTILYIASALTLIAYIAPIYVTFLEWSVYTIPYLLFGFLAFEEMARGHGRMIKNEIFNMARCPVLIRAIPTFFIEKKLTFKVTPKVKGRASFYLFPWLILIMNVFALTKSGIDYMNGSAALDGWPFLIVAMWCILGLWLSINVCYLTWRTNKNRRSFSRFDINVPVQLTQGENQTQAIITQLSDKGLSLKAADKNESLPSGRCNGDITICEQNIPFEVNLRLSAKDEQAGGSLIWTSEKDRDDYQYLIMIDRIRYLRKVTNTDDKTLIAPLARCLHIVKSSLGLKATT